MTKDRNSSGDAQEPYSTGRSLLVRATDHDFQKIVIEKLGRLETNMEMLVGNGQPGRVKQAEDRLTALEKNDIRRSVYDRLLNAAISMTVSATIALHEHWGLR
jgi:hypothetical protein